MDISGLLSVAAEISVAFAGFAGLITAVRKPGEITRVEAVGLAMIVWNSLSVMFMAMGMLVLLSLDFSLASVCRITSGVGSLSLFLGLAYAFKSMRSKILKQWSSEPLLALGWLIPLALMVVNAMNLFGLYFDHELGPIVISGFFSLLIAAYYFARLLLDPVLREPASKPSSQNSDLPKSGKDLRVAS